MSQRTITKDEFIGICQQIRANSVSLPDDPEAAKLELMRRLIINIRSYFSCEDPGAGVQTVENAPSPLTHYYVAIQQILNKHHSGTFNLEDVINDNLLNFLD